jgi:sugar porter (SP) family MFS transporter
VAFGPFSVGLSKGYSSPALASLSSKLDDSDSISVSADEGSWVASLSLLGALLGGLLSSLVLRHGRRNCLLIVSIPFSLSWWLTVFATSVEMIYCTAFLAGLCSAIVMLVSQVYISEIAHPALRGRLSASLKIFSHLGLLSAFLMGAWLDWRQLALVCAAAPLMLLVTVQYAPETPSYLIYSDQMEKAERSLQWLRGGSSDDVTAELATIQVNIAASREEPLDCKFVLVPKLIKPMLITCSLMFFNRFSGVVAFNFYAVTIFSQVFSDINPHLGAVVTAITQLVASCVSGVLSDKLGRRPLLIISGLLMTMALSGFGLYALYHDIRLAGHGQPMGESLDYIPLICVLIFEFAFSTGVSPISWLILGEVFPIEYRAIGTSLTTAFSYLCAFLGVKTFVDFTKLFGLYGTFWTYGGITFIGVIFYLVVVPETREEPLQEMRVKTPRPYRRVSKA